MVIVSKGDIVWYDSGATGEFDLAVGGVVQQADGGQILIKTDDGEDIWVPTAENHKIKVMHPSSAEGVDDMIKLGDLHEAGILRNLQIRYKDKKGCKIYTYTGSILVAVNPYQVLESYDAHHIEKYKNRKIGELPPHIFAIADNAYYFMRRDKRNQACIISGESGAGKTESTKLILQFLAAVSGQHSWIEQQILEANPILEAFGNAKTIRNDNSSRFGKFIDVHFDQDGAIEGARIEQYLLEKSRLAQQAPNERNYHIFYRIIVGCSDAERASLFLTKAEDYVYLTGGQCINLPHVDDVEEWQRIRGAMKVLGFEESLQWDIFGLTAVCIILGNLEFASSQVNNMDASTVSTDKPLRDACKLLKVDPALLGEALTARSTTTRGETIVTRLGVSDATDVRDAFVKAVYGRIFIFIVDKINKAIYKPQKDSSRLRLSIGVLDIFGFENFAINSFEQLCINYTNEALQQFFVRNIFKMEQDEYDKEAINWARITFTDNQATLDMLAEKAPSHIFAIIDEETRFPKGSDATLLQKLNATHGGGDDGKKTGNPNYLQPKRADKTFGVKHFAGHVYYLSTGFLDKNRDTFSWDLVNVISASTNEYLKQLFVEDLTQGQENRKKSATLGAQFKKSLESLMRTLGECNPFFVRCVKPNEVKTPNVFDRTLCTRQLRYSGMMETIRIRKAGYPIRHTFAEFIKRYRLLNPSIPAAGSGDDKASAMKLAASILGESSVESWQPGKSKIFLKDAHDQELEVKRDDMFTSRAIVLQKLVRGALQRYRFGKIKENMVVFQMRFRAYLTRQRLEVLSSGLNRLQAVLEMKKRSTEFKNMRLRMVGLQTRCRGWLARQSFNGYSQSLAKIQAVFRMVLACQRTQVLKREAEAEMIREQAIKRGLSPKEADQQKADHLKKIRDEEVKKRDQAQAKRLEIEKAERDGYKKARADVDDSAMVDEMFGFVDEAVNGFQQTTGEACVCS